MNNSETTVKHVSDTLGRAEKTIRSTVDAIASIGERAKAHLRNRDAVDASIVETTESLRQAALARDEAALAKLAGQLQRELAQRQNLSRQFDKAWDSDALAPIMEPLANVANAALAVAPALKAIEKHMLELPQPVIQSLFTGVSKIAFAS